MVRIYHTNLGIAKTGVWPGFAIEEVRPNPARVDGERACVSWCEPAAARAGRAGGSAPRLAAGEPGEPVKSPESGSGSAFLALICYVYTFFICDLDLDRICVHIIIAGVYGPICKYCSGNLELFCIYNKYYQYMTFGY